MKTGKGQFWGVALGAIMLLALAAQPAAAGPVIIDFETDDDGNPLGAGDLITNQFSDYFVVSTVSNPENAAMIFDSSDPSGGDQDLGTPNVTFSGPGGPNDNTSNDTALYNILIITEDGDTTDPDDDAGGGTITFEFNGVVAMHEVGILDIDREPGGTLKLFDGATEVASFALADTGNNGFAEYDFGGAMGDSLEVFLKSSGAVTGFTFDPDQVPEPAALALCGLAIAGIVMRRRRKS